MPTCCADGARPLAAPGRQSPSSFSRSTISGVGELVSLSADCLHVVHQFHQVSPELIIVSDAVDGTTVGILGLAPTGGGALQVRSGAPVSAERGHLGEQVFQPGDLDDDLTDALVELRRDRGHGFAHSRHGASRRRDRTDFAVGPLSSLPSHGPLADVVLHRCGLPGAFPLFKVFS
jgi:hypothetical protein